MGQHRVKGAWNWRRALIQSDLHSTTKHVLLTLSCHVPETGNSCFPSLSTLMEETSLARSTVQDHLVRARDEGWIQKRVRNDGDRQTSNLYVLTFPQSPQGEGPSDGPPQGGGPGTRAGEGPRDGPPGARETGPKSLQEKPTGKAQSGRTRPREDSADAGGQGEIFDAPAVDFTRALSIAHSHPSSEWSEQLRERLTPAGREAIEDMGGLDAIQTDDPDQARGLRDEFRERRREAAEDA